MFQFYCYFISICIIISRILNIIVVASLCIRLFVWNAWNQPQPYMQTLLLYWRGKLCSTQHPNTTSSIAVVTTTSIWSDVLRLFKAIVIVIGWIGLFLSSANNNHNNNNNNHHKWRYQIVVEGRPMCNGQTVTTLCTTLRIVHPLLFLFVHLLFFSIFLLRRFVLFNFCVKTKTNKNKMFIQSNHIKVAIVVERVKRRNQYEYMLYPRQGHSDITVIMQCNN